MSLSFQPSEDRNITILIRGGEKYIFLWGDSRGHDVVAVANRFAANPDLSFTDRMAELISKRAEMVQ